MQHLHFHAGAGPEAFDPDVICFRVGNVIPARAKLFYSDVYTYLYL
jgi:hypothetical protein